MRSRGRTLIVLAVMVAAVVAILVLRGGGGGTKVSHDELVRRANATCATLARRNRALEAPPKPYDHQSADFFTGMGDNVEAAHEELDALDPPSADRAELDRLVGLYDKADVEMEQLQTAAAVDQGQEIESLIDETGLLTMQMAASEQKLGICPGDTSVRVSIAANLRRSRPNPLTETGPLGG